MSKPTKRLARGKGTAVRDQQHDTLQKTRPKCFVVFDRGIKTSSQFSEAMSLLMADIIAERVTPSRANALCNASGKMLKNVEMQQRWGKSTEKGQKELPLR